MTRSALVFAAFATVTFSACEADQADQGDGSISGQVSNHAFDAVGASFRIGEPDDPDRTIVVYVFDAPVACADLDAPGWDERIGDDVQSLEMKLIGTAPGDYEVVVGPSLSMGEASVNYTLTSTTDTPQEISATGGKVTLMSIDASESSGEFDLDFGDGQRLQGQFRAVPCAGGREP